MISLSTVEGGEGGKEAYRTALRGFAFYNVEEKVHRLSGGSGSEVGRRHSAGKRSTDRPQFRTRKMQRPQRRPKEGRDRALREKK